MSELLRTDTIFGKRANILGNISADLVLESLGKIYIKSRNSAKTLEEVIQSVATVNPSDIGSRTIILDGIEQLDKDSTKEGQFIFDKSSNILYLFIEGEPIELINVAPEGTGYVKRSGDTMTGRLTINVPNGAPLYVNSSELVQNLNANYLQGYSGEQFAKKNKDEKITGKWTFKAPTYFQSNIKAQQDIIVDGSVGSSSFASGFSGYGWRMDVDTNTLTVDNLVVRKLMQVYELVVNRISATNGSLWVTNAGKVVKVQKLPIYTKDIIQTGRVQFESQLHELVNQLEEGLYFALFPAKNSNTVSTYSGNEIVSSSGADRSTRSITTYNSSAREQAIVVKVKNMQDILTFVSQSDNPTYYELTTTFSLDQQEEQTGYLAFKLFDDNFKFDTQFPIIPRDYYHAFEVSEEFRKKYLEEAKNDPDQDYAYYTIELGQAISEAGLWPGDHFDRFLEPNDVIANIKPYYKYFTSSQNENYYVVTFDDDQLPVFKPGDILRCQKWTYGGIKYYDAVVCNYIDTSTYVIQLADSFMDYTTRVEYNSNLEPKVTVEYDVRNATLYESSVRTSQSIYGTVEKDDSLVQMGNLWDTQRQNAVYITSTDDAAPFIDVMSGLNRPDFSVLYYTPNYQTVKLFQKGAYTGIGCTNDAVPYTGYYYVQKNNQKAEYAIGTYSYNDQDYKLFIVLANNPSSLSRLTSITYLSSSPNDNTQFGGEAQYGELLTEQGGTIITEDGNYTLVKEDVYYSLRADSTKTTKVRLGKLDGIKDELFPPDKQPYGYGLYSSNAFLIGEFYLSNGRSLAEISDEAIVFAQAVRDSTQLAIDILRNDTNAMDKRLSISVARLKNNVYTKNQLLSAGMMIKENVLGLWGGSVQIFTTYDELYGWSSPTALFENGKIQGKLLEVNEAHCINNADIPATQFIANNVTYTSSDPTDYPGTVRVYRRKYYNKTVNGVIYFNEGDTVEYVRRFSTANGYVWLKVNPDGYPPKDSVGNYQVNYPIFQHFNTDGSYLEYSDGIITGSAEIAFINEYTSPLKTWGLEYDGRGNLGNSTIYWNTNGRVVVNGVLYSKEGNIGGLNLSNYSLFTISESDDSIYNPLVISTQDYSYVNNEGVNVLNSLPYIQLQAVDAHRALRNKSILTSGGLYYMAATQDSSTSSSWYNYETMQVPGAVFSLTVIPIWGEDCPVPALFVRLMTNFKCFQLMYLSYTGGHYYLHFPSAPSYRRSIDWFIKNLISGNVQMQISGLCSGISDYNFDQRKNYIHSKYSPDSNGYYPSANKIGGGSYSKWMMFNADAMLDDPSITFSHGSDEIFVKASLEYIGFTGNTYSYGRPETLSQNSYSRQYRWGAKIKRQEDLSMLSQYDSGGIYSWGSTSNLFASSQFNDNLIWITTSDDASANWGGFTLIAHYNPTFNAQMIEDTEVKNVDYTQSDWDAQERENHPTNP